MSEIYPDEIQRLISECRSHLNGVITLHTTKAGKISYGWQALDNLRLIEMAWHGETDAAPAEGMTREGEPWIALSDQVPSEIGFYLIYFCEDWNHGQPWKIGWAFYNSENKWALENGFVMPAFWMRLPKAPALAHEATEGKA